MRKRSRGNAFHRHALKKMKEAESHLPPVPHIIPRLCELLKLGEEQCVYCLKVVPNWNAPGRQGDEVYPCTMPGLSHGVTPHCNGRMNRLNKYTCCGSCNRSKSNRFDKDFIDWVLYGGCKKESCLKIPFKSRQIIIDWYIEVKPWITTDDQDILSKMSKLYDEIVSLNRYSRTTHIHPSKTYASNDRLIHLLETNPRTQKKLANHLGVSSSCISLWKNYKNSKNPREVPKKHRHKIDKFFKKLSH